MRHGEVPSGDRMAPGTGTGKDPRLDTVIALPFLGPLLSSHSPVLCPLGNPTSHHHHSALHTLVPLLSSHSTARAHAQAPGQLSTAVVLPFLYLTRRQLQTVAAMQDFWSKHCHQPSDCAHPFSLAGAMVLAQGRLHVIGNTITWKGGWVVEVAPGPLQPDASQLIPIQDTCDWPYPVLDPAHVSRLCDAFDKVVVVGTMPAIAVEQVRRVRLWLMRLNQAVPHINDLLKAERCDSINQQEEALRTAAVHATRQAVLLPETPEETKYLQDAVRACMEASAAAQRQVSFMQQHYNQPGGCQQASNPPVSTHQGQRHASHTQQHHSAPGEEQPTRVLMSGLGAVGQQQHQQHQQHVPSRQHQCGPPGDNCQPATTVHAATHGQQQQAPHTQQRSVATGKKQDAATEGQQQQADRDDRRRNGGRSGSPNRGEQSTRQRSRSSRGRERREHSRDRRCSSSRSRSRSRNRDRHKHSKTSRGCSKGRHSRDGETSKKHSSSRGGRQTRHSRDRSRSRGRDGRRSPAGRAVRRSRSPGVGRRWRSISPPPEHRGSGARRRSSRSPGRDKRCRSSLSPQQRHHAATYAGSGNTASLEQESSWYNQRIIPHLEKAGKKGMNLRQIKAACPIPVALMQAAGGACNYFRNSRVFALTYNLRVVLADRLE